MLAKAPGYYSVNDVLRLVTVTRATMANSA